MHVLVSEGMHACSYAYVMPFLETHGMSKYVWRRSLYVLHFFSHAYLLEALFCIIVLLCCYAVCHRYLIY
jgi:hypothetical protein